MIPISQTVSEEEVIARIKIDLRLVDTTEHDSHLEILIREALGSLNCISQLEKKQCTSKVEDGKMQLPKDLVQFIALRPKSWLPSDPSDPCPTYSNYPADCWRFIYANTAFLNGCGCDNLGAVNYQYGFQINKGFIHFNSHMNIDEATVAYLGMWLDSNGKRAIFERYERAVTAYACWKFTRTWDEKYPQYKQESYKMEWVLQQGKLQGQDVKAEFDRNKMYISAIMRALIVSPSALIE